MLKYYPIIFLLLISIRAECQDFILSPNQVETSKSQAEYLIKNYETSLNSLGDEQTPVQEKEYFVTDVLKNTFEGDEALVYNELDPGNTESKDLTIRTYLNNIITKFNKGLQITYSDITISDPYYLDKNSFFIKVALASNLEGIHIDQPVNTFHPLDIYLKFVLDEVYNIGEPKIYSISAHRENIDEFTPVPIDKEAGSITFTFISPGAKHKFRRGKEYLLQWKGNDMETPVRLELIKDKKVQGVINPVVVGTKFNWRIPSDQKLGKDYSIRIVNLRNKENTSNSREFTIKRKVSLGLKAAIVAGLGGATYYIISQKEDNKEPLPLPPVLP